MDELNKEYTMLFNGISSTIVQLETLVERLKILQQKAEDAYLEQLEKDEEFKEKQNQDLDEE